MDEQDVRVQMALLSSDYVLREGSSINMTLDQSDYTLLSISPQGQLFSLSFMIWMKKIALYQIDGHVAYLQGHLNLLLQRRDNW